MLQEYFKLNKNILIAFAVSITFSAIIAQSLAEQEDYLNSFYTLIFDHLFYLSTFGGLYYLGNRKKYILKSGKTDKEKLRHDLIKIITSLGIAAERHLVSNFLGTTDMRIDVGTEVVLRPRDTIMLASDGLMDNVHVDEIIERIRKGPLDNAAGAVITLANRRMAGPTATQPSKPDDLSLILFRKLYRPSAGLAQQS